MSIEDGDPNKIRQQYAAEWLNTIREFAEATGLKVESSERFLLTEKFFWLGLRMGIDAAGGNERELVHSDIGRLLFAGQSPVLHFKPKQVRGPRKKKVDKPEETSEPGSTAAAA